ncbi:SDR family oxidoreductase [Sphingobium sp. HBC34]|uniref:SDR family oxidoreductase n=1 Tax=Sphingobium cyanobacteriorum TaxID=3063954 RepID=A0ABT8ZS00_9SPHN|nr:SDR family oxidoreductase [Sphingobium sp. HBC34]MDO7837316.1 SDR family oxidoreductase [Sphingobium sp. HBC34]
MIRHENAVVVVTGAASGVGAATARRFAAEGAKILLCDVQDAAAPLEAIRAAGGVAEQFRVDLSAAGAGSKIIAEAGRIFGGVDILIHNAGFGTGGTIETTSEADLQKVFQINLMAAISLARAAIPVLRGRGGGSLLFTSALAGRRYLPNAIAYSVSKAAIDQLTRALAMDHAREGIRVNAVAPGPVNTPMLHEACQVYGISPDRLAAGMPTGRLTEPDEIAALFAYLASADARSITGQVIGMDGGMSAGFFPPAPAGDHA